MEENFRQIEESVMEVLRQFKEIVRLQDNRLRRLEENNGGKMSDSVGTTPGLPSMPQEAARPTEEQVYEYMRTCMERTLREDVARKLAREFLRYNDRRGWKNKDGEAIVEWENCAKGWVRKKEGDRGESIYEQETQSRKLSVGKPKLFGDTFSQIIHPTDER